METWKSLIEVLANETV